MKKSLIGVVVLVLILVGAGVLVLKKSAKKTSNTTSSSNTTTAANTAITNPATDNSSTNNSVAPDAATITYGDNGFSPSSVTVKAGGKLTVKNDSSTTMQFDSDPHPVHTDDPEINIGTIEPGASKTITVTVTGTHGYHNHLSPDQTGTLIVQ